MRRTAKLAGGRESERCTVPAAFSVTVRDPGRDLYEDYSLRAMTVHADDRFPPIKQDGALYNRIAKHVEELIRSEQLRPGDRLPAERRLADMLGVSRVPIREAMRSLATQGLIEVRRGHGMFVAQHSVEAAVEQFTI